MNRIWRKGRWGQWLGAFGALMAVLYPQTETRAVVGYLPTVGPPPLRIWLTSTNIFDYSRFELALTAKAQAQLAADLATNQMGIATTKTNTAPVILPDFTKPEKITGDQVYSAGMIPPPPMEEQNGPMPMGNFNFPGATASDMLPATPQMIAQYLRPEPYGTNMMDRPGSVVFVPADMPFVPPPVRPNSDSRASYHVK
jgi:hypothetical protein